MLQNTRAKAERRIDRNPPLRILERADAQEMARLATRLLYTTARVGVGSKELACGSQAFIATLLFDPSMSALPIIVKQNSPSVGLFTH